MLSKRALKISIIDVSIYGLVTRSYLHGGVLSPLLWNIILDSLIYRLNNVDDIYRIASADDLDMQQVR